MLLFVTPSTIVRSSVHVDSPGKNIGVGCHALLPGIFPTQGSNLGVPHCRQILYQLSHQGSPRILEWAAYPFSSRSSRPRNWTGISCIAGGFFTNWAIREDPIRKAQSKTLIIANASKGVGQQDSRHRWWDYKVEQPLWKTARQFLTN